MQEAGIPYVFFSNACVSRSKLGLVRLPYNLPTTPPLRMNGSGRTLDEEALQSAISRARVAENHFHVHEGEPFQAFSRIVNLDMTDGSTYDIWSEERERPAFRGWREARRRSIWQQASADFVPSSQLGAEVTFRW